MISLGLESLVAIHTITCQRTTFNCSHPLQFLASQCIAFFLVAATLMTASQDKTNSKKLVLVLFMSATRRSLFFSPVLPRFFRRYLFFSIYPRTHIHLFRLLHGLIIILLMVPCGCKALLIQAAGEVHTPPPDRQRAQCTHTPVLYTAHGQVKNGNRGPYVPTSAKKMTHLII